MRLEVLAAMHETGLVPVFYHGDPQVVIGVAEACAAGGARLIEVTNRGDFAWQAFAELERHCTQKLPQLITGVGSIVDPETAALYVNCGANFVVGPNLNPDVARFCNRRKVPYSPGCGTASEIARAEELGVEIVKIFPGEVIGPEFVRALRAPCPWTSIMPTGGVDATEESLTEWFQAGIVCAGIGSKLITKDLVTRRDYAGITRNVRQALDIIARVKAGGRAGA
jgi:2-dehydro-3-deoxyphosphogluconate aldolase/(4S)-4-hydroxy-2-oxoglutarate aldolase